MSEPAITVRNIGKSYHLGLFNRQTLTDEVQYWWHKLRGRDPRTHMGKIGSNAKATEVRRLEAEQMGQSTFWALKDVSFDVQPGEVVGIIGRNGAGKSTLLKIISRITEPTEGEIFINGRIGSLLEVGTGFHPELSGRENIYMNGTILGMKKTEIARKFDEIVAFAELEKFLDTPVKRYSSGMYVRLAFAVAAHLEPEILLVDEVLAVGDASFQKKCLNKMEDVSAAGRTVLFVSHNMPAIARLCSRAILIDSGRVADSGPSDKVVSAYLSNAAESEVSREWTLDNAPGGSGDVKLLKVEVMRANGTPITVAHVNEELAIRLTYRVNVPGLRFRCLVSCCTQGVIAFTTLEPTEEVREKAGVYSSRVIIPSNLLAEKEYILNVSIFASRGAKLHYVKVKDVLSFQATDPVRGDSARGDYTERLAGVVRPLLEWEMTRE